MVSTLVKVPIKVAPIINGIEYCKKDLDELIKFGRRRGITHNDDRLLYSALPRVLHELYETVCADSPEFKEDVERIIGVRHGLSEEQKMRLIEIDRYIENLHFKPKMYSSE